jgi:hypothetical protein
MNSQGSAGFPDLDRWTREARHDAQGRSLLKERVVPHASRCLSGPSDVLFAGRLVFPCSCKSLAELKSEGPRPLNVQTFASTAAETSGVEPELAPDPAVAHTQA